MLWIMWQLATLAGILLGSVIPPAWQLEFVVPLCFLSLLAPLLRDQPTLIVMIAAAVGVVALDAMPMRLSMICAGLLGILAGIVADRVGVRRD